MCVCVRARAHAHARRQDGEQFWRRMIMVRYSSTLASGGPLNICMQSVSPATSFCCISSARSRETRVARDGHASSTKTTSEDVECGSLFGCCISCVQGLGEMFGFFSTSLFSILFIEFLSRTKNYDLCHVHEVIEEAPIVF